MITYGFPCQDISVAGKQQGITKETRSGLVFDVLEGIKIKKPKYAICENVKNLVGKKFRKDFDNILSELESYGYKNYWAVLNAKDYGVPQNRERVYVISIRKDIKKDFIWPKGKELKLKLLDILEEDAELPILHNIYGGFKETKPREFHNYSPTIRTAAGGGHIPSVRTGTYRLKDGFVEKNTSATIDACYSKGFSNHQSRTAIVSTDRIRKLTPLECFRLMGFDDEDFYKLRQGKLSNTQIYKCAGNSIVVDVLEAIFRQLLCPTIEPSSESR